ncbi:MAG: hypothetical protein RLZZ175_49 [Bacteroidota bacterium]|jgi:transcriptional regulator with XRE-family HTH domain
MENNITDRVKEIMEREGLSPSSFADTIGVQRPSVSHILSGRNKPSLDMIQKTLQKFTNINPYWLLNGEGEMLQTNLFETIDQSAKKELEKKELQKAKRQDKPKSERTNVNFVQAALMSNVLDDEEVILPEPKRSEPIVVKEEIVVNNSNQQKTIVNNSIKEELKAIEVQYQEKTIVNQPVPIVAPQQVENPVVNQVYNNQNTPQNNNQQQVVNNQPSNNQQKSADSSMMEMMFGGNGNKKIERIVIFYDDKTFSVYNPE